MKGDVPSSGSPNSNGKPSPNGKAPKGKKKTRKKTAKKAKRKAKGQTIGGKPYPGAYQPEGPLVLGHVAPGAPEANLGAIKHYGHTWDSEGGFWRNAAGDRICGAHPADEGKGPCRHSKEKLFQNWRCYFHGGPTPAGAASVNYKGERWSAIMSPKRQRAFMEAAEDPALLDLTRALALLDTHVREAIERRENLDTPDFRKRALALFNEARRLMDTDPQAAGLKLQELGELLERGVSEDNATAAIDESVDRYATHTKKAWDIRLKAGNAITRGDYEAQLGHLLEIMVDETPDECHSRILARYDRELLGGRLAASGVNTALRGRGD